MKRQVERPSRLVPYGIVERLSRFLAIVTVEYDCRSRWGIRIHICFLNIVLLILLYTNGIAWWGLRIIVCWRRGRMIRYVGGYGLQLRDVCWCCYYRSLKTSGEKNIVLFSRKSLWLCEKDTLCSKMKKNIYSKRKWIGGEWFVSDCVRRGRSAIDVKVDK